MKALTQRFVAKIIVIVSKLVRLRVNSIMKHKWIFCGLLTLSMAAFSQSAVQPLLDKVNAKRDFIERVETASGLFIGKPYVLGPLGEGKVARYDQHPLYTFDGFDCFTYVTTSLALALAKSEQEFISWQKQLGYRDGKVDYISRNHFTSLDWNRNNRSHLKDITAKISNGAGDAIVKRSAAIIDKRAWFMRKQAKDLYLPELSETEKANRVQQLHRAVRDIKPQNVVIDYLPLASIFDASGKADPAILEQIPHGAIVEIVRPNWNLKDKIGTNLHISHLGFAIRKPGEPLIFRQASSLKKRVIDCDLEAYLRGYLDSETVKGIAVLLPTD